MRGSWEASRAGLPYKKKVESKPTPKQANAELYATIANAVSCAIKDSASGNKRKSSKQEAHNLEDLNLASLAEKLQVSDSNVGKTAYRFWASVWGCNAP